MSFKFFCYTAITLSLVAGTLTTGSTTPVNAEVLLKQEFKFFKVRGKTSRQIFQDFQVKSPIKAKGQFDATLGVAAIKLTPEVEYVQSRNRCRVGKSKVNADIVIHLPRWVNYKNSDKLAKLSWDTLFSDIKRHELQHAKIAKDYAGRIQRKIAGYGARRNCDTLERALTRASRKLLAKHDRAQRKFDRKEQRRIFARGR